MTHEVQEALNEILDMPPMFRQEFIINYIRKHLPKDEAKMLFMEKDLNGYLGRMKQEGYALKLYILEIIGKERVVEYINNYIDQS